MNRDDRPDAELEAYRKLMVPPETYGEGFTPRSILGAFFVGLIMMPGAIYLGLIAGVSLGSATEWVTIILFSELARRSFTPLTRQEIYVIYYIAGGLAGSAGATVLAGGPFGQLIWNQYLTQSQAAQGFGIAHQIPNWVAPESGVLIKRSFLHLAWLPAITILVFSQVLARAEWFSLGYLLFRITSDVERLPFPLAPVAAQGATALAESSETDDNWRWRVFSIGMSLGLGFGGIYVGLPALTGLIASNPITLLPIPWIDLTRTTEHFLPAAPLGIGTDLGLVILGMVLPFWVVLGSFTAAMVHALGSPLLYYAGYLTHWRPGMDTIMTNFSNDVDVWLSVYIGAGVAVGAIGIFHVMKALRTRSKEKGMVGWKDCIQPPVGRGDVSLWGAVGVYLLTTFGAILLCMYLLEDDDFPLLFLLIFGFLLTPVVSYVNARMAGLTGLTVGFPMIKEGALILSGYRGVDIWFVPIPYADHGRRAQLFREVELTGTRLRSVLKAELLLLPLSLLCGFIFWSLIWEMSPIPSPAFQFAQTYWHLIALRQSLWYSSTASGGPGLFDEAIKIEWIVGGFGLAGGAFLVLSWLRMPLSLIYGFVRGIQGLPHMLIPEMVGALIGRYSLERRFGIEKWRRYAPVLFAGFACGMGLIGMSAVAVALISRSVSQLRF